MFPHYFIMYSRLCFHGARPGLVMGGSSELFQCMRACHNLHFILLTKKKKNIASPASGDALPKLTRFQCALPRNFLQCDDRIESLSISGVPPLAPGRCCHYACLQSWELNTLAGSEREDWQRQRERGKKFRYTEKRERENVSAPRRCFELSEMHVLS